MEVTLDGISERLAERVFGHFLVVFKSYVIASIHNCFIAFTSI